MWKEYYNPASVEEALSLLATHGEKARVIAGGTDLVLDLERGVRHPAILVDISRIAELRHIRTLGDAIELGAAVTHGQVISSPLLVDAAFPLAASCLEVGSPQIRNRGTIVGNLANASPAGDTITPLRAMDASVVLSSKQRGRRELSFDEFFLGVRRTALQPDEMVTAVRFPALTADEHGAFLKLGLRQAQAIALINVAVVIGIDNGTIARASVALGAVAPTIVRAGEAEESLVGRPLADYSVARAARLAAEAARPIDDIRASADYRRAKVQTLTSRALKRILQGKERADWPERQVTLTGLGDEASASGYADSTKQHFGPSDAIQLEVNGRQVAVSGAADKTLLHLLRDELGLTGAKEGCAEGECGACTVWMDGMAVQSCLVPVPRAHGSRVVTIEGLGSAQVLHPVQQAFVDQAAVQCGYCTPGLIMSAAGLIEELPEPTRGEIQQALTGNLCRCTGYNAVVRAVEQAAIQMRRAGPVPVPVSGPKEGQS